MSILQLAPGACRLQKAPQGPGGCKMPHNEGLEELRMSPSSESRVSGGLIKGDLVPKYLHSCELMRAANEQKRD